MRPIHPQPIKQRYPWNLSKEKSVTIIAGFHVQNGILLAADTMYTGGTKIHQPKLFGYTLNGNTPESCSLVFALAGHENYGKMAIDDCVDEILSCEPKLRTLKAVKKALRKAVKAINDEYVDTRPDPTEKEFAKFDLIIGAWLPVAGGLQMFRSSGPAVLSAGHYHCTGIGAYLGDYLMRNVFTDTMARTMKIKAAALLAIQALGAAKTYDSNCGGDTQFMRISPGGMLSPVVPYDVHTSEYYISEFESFSRKLLFNIGDADISDKDFDTWLSAFAENMRRIRACWKGQGFDYLSRQLSQLTGAAPPNPQPPKAGPTPQQPSQE
jgi:hypothetical protein